MFIILIINFSDFFSLLTTYFLTVASLLSGCLYQAQGHFLLWVGFFPYNKLLSCGKSALRCAPAADSLKWKRWKAAARNAQEADRSACSAASAEKWQFRGYSLRPAANAEPPDSWEAKSWGFPPGQPEFCTGLGFCCEGVKEEKGSLWKVTDNPVA